ncbi:hypothetical protein MPTK1_4g22480 [Marchantia polymorpha subsp. ruderalis]|uniref:Uncharacterized protein n=2 Tax=Marchantia polymorpha TaxID=3197 RepID=A0AAF6BCN0_MARPO|nr:hypothetical protein MARPO_0020s0018 [Marchantia polymorpha]BBN09764.1 hypothetical protein Mp_4g22480 [Marchantia polymorpha subsp. ruderalis]|eukprot:PTQ44346.1 hypothetical protein MARPO_0020s0018 [Marchantia polymorpha]
MRRNSASSSAIWCGIEESVFFYAIPHSRSRILGLPTTVDELERNRMIFLMELLKNHTARMNEEFSQYRYRSNDSKPKRARFTSYAFHALHETKLLLAGGTDMSR